MVRDADGVRRRGASSGARLFGKAFTLAVLVVGVALSAWASSLLLANADLHRIARPARSKTFVRGLATLEPDGAFSACLATGRRGKKTVWLHLNGDATVRFADGFTATLPDASTVEFFRQEEPRGASVPEALARANALSPGVAFRVACLGRDEKVWVEACLEGRELHGCAASGGHVLLTPGGPELRDSYVRAHAYGWLALAFFGAVLALRALWSFAAFDRPIVPSLSVHGGGPSGEHGPAYWILLVLAGFVALVTIGTWVTVWGPLFGGSLLILEGVLLLIALVRRARVLGHARRVLHSSHTTRLHADGAGERELAVRVPEDAPVVEGLALGVRHAFVQLTLRERYTRKTSSHKHVISTREIATLFEPALLPIEDASGRGVLDPTHCTIDVVPEDDVGGDGPLPHLPAWVTERIGPLPVSADHRGYEATWRTIDPGEPLLVFGSIERVHPDHAGASPGYRTPAMLPIVRGRPESNTIAFVGSERTILRGTSLERLAVWALLTLTTLGIVAVVAVTVWIFG